MWKKNFEETPEESGVYVCKDLSQQDYYPLYYSKSRDKWYKADEYIDPYESPSPVIFDKKKNASWWDSMYY